MSQNPSSVSQSRYNVAPLRRVEGDLWRNLHPGEIIQAGDFHELVPHPEDRYADEYNIGKQALRLTYALTAPRTAWWRRIVPPAGYRIRGLDETPEPSDKWCWIGREGRQSGGCIAQKCWDEIKVSTGLGHGTTVRELLRECEPARAYAGFDDLVCATPLHWLPVDRDPAGAVPVAGARARATPGLLDCECSSAEAAVSNAFIWRTTPEGHAFLASVSAGGRPEIPRPVPPAPQYRELTEEEFQHLRKIHRTGPGYGADDVEVWSHTEQRWLTPKDWGQCLFRSPEPEPFRFNGERPRYRTTRPAGTFLPPAPALKPWTLDTVPKGDCWVRFRSDRPVVTYWQRIAAIGLYFVVLDGTRHTYDELLESYEHTLDGGETWKRCGQEVTP